MENYKTEILSKICYTNLVYNRINKKLNFHLSNEEIEKMIFEIILKTPESKFLKKGKNIYVTNVENNICITVNCFTFRVITADKLENKQTLPNVVLFAKGI